MGFRFGILGLHCLRIGSCKGLNLFIPSPRLRLPPHLCLTHQEIQEIRLGNRCIYVNALDDRMVILSFNTHETATPRRLHHSKFLVVLSIFYFPSIEIINKPQVYGNLGNHRQRSLSSSSIHTQKVILIILDEIVVR